ncbi:MAG: mpl, partial [Proteobacteria bacterium]|nr:mpl [Pseudomonadota bacterium]
RSPYFVIEADEYDTAFFDKRSKFLHYRPRTVILNNLEYDHADIFPDLGSIQRQFHHLVRMVPGNGLIIAPGDDDNLKETLRMGCWTEVQKTGLLPAGEGAWQARLLRADGGEFEILNNGQAFGTVAWDLTGIHNVRNALAATAAACHAGVAADKAISALSDFQNVKRRMEVLARVNGITLYDDFAHHPTAIATTLEGLRAKVDGQRIIAVLEPRSNTMRMGVHAGSLPASLRAADRAVIYQAPELGWDISATLGQTERVGVMHSLDDIVAWLAQECRPGDHLVFMSNGSFGGIHRRFENVLKAAA